MNDHILHWAEYRQGQRWRNKMTVNSQTSTLELYGKWGYYTINRAIQSYQKKGYDEKWINQRLKSIEIRKELTDEWQNRGVKEGLEYAILTNEIL